MASTNYINECKNDAYKNRLGKIEVAEKKATTGTSIKIEKGADSATDLTLYGKSTQETRSGKNLFDASKIPSSTGIVVTENGKTITMPVMKSGNGITSTNITLSQLAPNLKVGDVVWLNAITTSTINKYIYLTGSGKLWAFSKSTTVTQDDLNSTVNLYANRYTDGETEQVIITDFRITKNSTDTWEPYGVMPSPDFPSPIESVGRKNLLKNTLVNETKNGITLKVNEDKSIILSGTATKDTPFYFMMPDNSLLLKQGTYTLSGNNSNSSNIKLLIHTKDWKLLGNNLIGGTTFTLNENTEVFVYAWVANGATINTTMYPMLEAGNTKTDYVPYEHTEISAEVVGKNLVNPTLQSYTKNGVTFTKNEDGTYTLNGTSTLAMDNHILGVADKSINVYKDKFYKLSSHVISGTRSGSGVAEANARLVIGDTKTWAWLNGGSGKAKQPTDDGYIDIVNYYIAQGITFDNYRIGIQLEIVDSAGAVETKWEQYKSNSLTIDLQGNELCSLPNGTKDEVNITNGEALLIKKSKKIKIDVSQIGTTSNYQNITYATIPKPQDFKGYGNYNSNFVMCTNASIYKSLFGTWDTANNINFIYSSAQLTKWWIGFQKDTTLEQMKSSLANAEILYELAEPETINLGTVEMPHTYDDVSYITNSADTEMTVKAYEWTDEITNDDNLQSIQIDSGCYTDGNIIGSVYVECLNANFVAETTNLVDKIIRCQIGVKYADLSTEYICKGKYIIERPNNEITAQMSQITAYSGLYTNLEAIYICNLDYSAGNITLKDVYIDVCKQLGLTPLKTDFLNSTIPITDNPFKNNEKNRVVLQTISKIACSFVNVYEDNNQIDLCWLSENAEPDYTFEMSDYVSVEGGQVICGPINCLIIKNSQIDDENVTIKDDESIKANGEHSITISDDYILHNAELRQQAITSIWNRVKGLKYVDCKLITYYGKPFLKLGNKIRIYTSDTDYFDTYVLKHKFEYDGAFASTIESPALTEQEIKTKQDISLGKALANVQIDLDKQKERITSTVTTTNALQDSVSNLSETVQEQANQTQTLSTTLTQTNQSLQAEVNQINESLENGVSSLKNKLVTIDINGIAVSTNTSAIKAIMNNDRFAIKSGDTEAFYVGYDENLKKSVSRMNDLTITDYFTAGYHRQEKFEIDGEKRTGWFYVGGE